METYRSFSTIRYCNFLESQKKQVEEEIESKEEEYIMNVDEAEYVNYLNSCFRLELLEIDKNSESIEYKKEKKTKKDLYYDQPYEVKIYTYTVTYKFTGSAKLFQIEPKGNAIKSYSIVVDEENNFVSFEFCLEENNDEEFNKQKNMVYYKAFVNLEKVNKNAIEFNSDIAEHIKTFFSKLKKELLEDHSFFLKLKINNISKPIYTDIIKKKEIPQPTYTGSAEPSMSQELHRDILDIIYIIGQCMEQKPSLYKNRKEEELRDIFLLFLETRYESTTATGETFNRVGKTDILLKFAKDATNLFVAECKFWHGEKELLDAISQLFSYLTWRDSKVALILFVQNINFSNVIDNIKRYVMKHSCFLKEVERRKDSSFSFIFHLPQDKNKEVFLEIMLFHFDK